LASAVDMQVEIVVLQHRVASRLTTPWIELDAEHVERELAAGRPIVSFGDIPFEWREFRVLFRLLADVLARYDVLEPPDVAMLRAMGREGRPEAREVEAWYLSPFERSHSAGAACAAGAPDSLATVLSMSARPFLARTVDALHQRVNLAPWTQAFCPFCGGAPEFALLPRTGGRRLVCARCTATWPFPEQTCPYCGNALAGCSTSFVSRDRRYRLTGCDACRKYVKAFDVRNADRPFLYDVDAVASLPLDAAALQRGYLG